MSARFGHDFGAVRVHTDRRVQGLVEQRPTEPSPPGARLLFPPDPEYWTHIQKV
jgi:hypothetical protein